MRADVVVLGLAVALTLGSSRQQQQPPAQQQPVFRAGTNLVEVDVYPRRDGRIVEGLSAADFEVSENGAPQAIAGFQFVRVEPAPVDVVRRDPESQREVLQAAADPRTRVIVTFLDTLHTTVSGAHAIRRPLMDTVRRAIGPADLFGLTSQNQRARDLVLGRRLESLEDQLRTHWDWGERHRLVDLKGMLTGLDDRDPLEAQIDRCFTTKVTPSGIAPWYINDGPTRRLFSEVIIERRREDRVISALEDLVDHLGAIRQARTVLLVVTDGWLWFPVDRGLPEHLMETEAVAPARPRVHQTLDGQLTTRDPYTAERNECNQELMRLASLDNPKRLRTLIEDARQRSVSIYPINPDGLTPDNLPVHTRTEVRRDAESGALATRHGMQLRERIAGLEELGSGTDGFAVVYTNDLATGLARVIEDTSAYYLLGYYSSNTARDGRYRTITVKVREPDVDVRARRGYLAPADQPSEAPGAVRPDAGAEALEAAFGRLARSRGDTPLELRAAADGRAVSVTVEVSTERAMAAQGDTRVRVALSAADGSSAGIGEAAIAKGTRGAVVRVVVSPEAVRPLRVNVEVGAGRDRVQDSIVVEESTAGLVGDAVVFRAMPSPRAPLVPAADMRFRRTERIHIEWPRLGELDRREARLLGRNGQPLPVPVAVTERDVDGRVAVAADVNLAPLTDGEYAIELTVGSGATVEKRVVAIRVSR